MTAPLFGYVLYYMLPVRLSIAQLALMRPFFVLHITALLASF